MRSRQSSSCSLNCTALGKVPAGMRRHAVGVSHHCINYAVVEAAAGGSQSWREVIWGHVGRGEWITCELESTSATRDEKLARSRRLLQRLQHGQQDGGS